MRKMKLFNRTISAIMAIVFTMLIAFIGWSNFNVSAATYNVIFPVNNGVKIAYYQKYDPKYKNHDGVDIYSYGDDTIYAAKEGTVVGTANSCPHTDELEKHKAGIYGEQGNYIKIKGTDGIYYWYYHLKQNTLLVSKGNKVSAGQPIATMGSSGQSSGKHLHFKMTTGSSYYSTEIIANPVGTYSGQVNYSNGPYKKNNYAEISQTNYYIKNASTGTYLNISGAKAANGQAAVLSAKKNANSFKFYASGSKDKGYYLFSLMDKSFALNPFSDSPSDGDKITLYKKSTDGTQLYHFEKSGNGYIIHNAYNENIVLTPSGSNVLLKTKSGAANQIWNLEAENITTVKFHRNLNSNDTNTVSETFTAGVANQKFGYKTDGTGRYKTMNAADVGFGEWTNPGYKLLGWSKDKNAAASSWDTYSSVVDSWIKSNAPSVDLYAVWQKVDSTVVTFHRNLNSNDTVTLQETFTSGVANQKFGYNTDGIGRYKTMNAADVGFGEWSNPGYKLLGWSKYKTASVSNFGTYNDVTDTWIKNNESAVDLFAIWEKERPLGDLNDDKYVTLSDLIILKKYLISAEKLDSTNYGDMNNDDKINIFDFIILKRQILS